MRAIVGSQSTLILGRYSAPEPDVMLLRPRADFYRRSTPTANDVLLLVEVSESTLPYDRKIKAPLYARHGIPELWIVNLRDRELHCMRQPHLNGYAEIETHQSSRPGPDLHARRGSRRFVRPVRRRPRSTRLVTHFHEQRAAAAGEVTIVAEGEVGAVGVGAVGDVVQSQDGAPVFGGAPAQREDSTGRGRRIRSRCAASTK